MTGSRILSEDRGFYIQLEQALTWQPSASPSVESTLYQVSAQFPPLLPSSLCANITC